MVTRRNFIRNAALITALPSAAITNVACTRADHYGAALPALRSPLLESTEDTARLRELVRCATLAANGHNTQHGNSGYRPM